MARLFLSLPNAHWLTKWNNKDIKLESVAWSEDESQIFMRYGHCFVPERPEQLEIISKLIPNTGAACHIADLCCGEGLLSEAILDRHPNAHAIAYDASDAMLNATAKRLKQFDGRFAVKKFDLADTNWRNLDNPIDAFVSSLAIHHLNCKEKQQLFKDCYKQLKPGGALIIADLVRPKTKIGLQIAANTWDEITEKQSLEYEDNLDGHKAFNDLQWNYFLDPDNDPIDRPSPLYEQLNWLDEAGFSDIDVYWLRAGHAIYGGYKL